MRRLRNEKEQVKGTASRVKLTASIVAYHTEAEELGRALDTLERSKCVERIYVVDNSAQPYIRNLCDERSERVVYIPSQNHGFGAGHNIAMRRAMDAGADYHLVMNSDVDFDSSRLESLLKYMEANKDIGAVQPRIVGPDGGLQYTVRMLPTPVDLILRRFLPKWMACKRRREYELRHIDHSRPFNVPYHQGSFMFLRAEALKECGLFDERFFMYPEDIDLTRRIHERYRTMYQPAVTVVHHHRRASYRSARMLMIHCVNMVRYFNKWGWVFDSRRREINRCLKKS